MTIEDMPKNQALLRHENYGRLSSAPGRLQTFAKLKFVVDERLLPAGKRLLEMRKF